MAERNIHEDKRAETDLESQEGRRATQWLEGQTKHHDTSAVESLKKYREKPES